MIRAAIIAVSLASPCVAQEGVTWGQSWAHINPATNGPVARLTVGNRLAYSPDTIVEYSLSTADVTIIMRVDQGNGEIPDTVTIAAPPGFFAVPDALTMDEGTDAEFLIYPIEAMPMG